jgi:hypothetical protein
VIWTYLVSSKLLPSSWLASDFKSLLECDEWEAVSSGQLMNCQTRLDEWWYAGEWRLTSKIIHCKIFFLNFKRTIITENICSEYQSNLKVYTRMLKSSPDLSSYLQTRRLNTYVNHSPNSMCDHESIIVCNGHKTAH